MKTNLIALILFLSTAVYAITHYVDQQGVSPTPPYTSWATAATNIQDAIDAAAPGASIIVTNGHYMLSAQLWVTNDISLISVNGPEVTILDGQMSVRCINSQSTTLLSGFMLQNGSGASGYGGGISANSSATVVSNCVIRNSSAGRGGGAYNVTIRDSMIMSNSAEWGGGCYQCNVIDSTVKNNWGTGTWSYGGGLCNGSASNSVIKGNAARYGGGTAAVTLWSCLVEDNRADPNNPSFAGHGGGTWSGTAYDCDIQNNEATHEGGGAYRTSLYDCLVAHNSSGSGGGLSQGKSIRCEFDGNSATLSGGGCYNTAEVESSLIKNGSAGNGGGVAYSSLINCTVVLNDATGGHGEGAGGGVFQGSLTDCIVSLNTNTAFALADEILQVDNIVRGWIGASPGFENAQAGDFRLAESSPCIDSGQTTFDVDATDLDGYPRVINSNVDFGAYEYIHSDDDWDGDGMSNSDEEIAGTVSTDNESFFSFSLILSNETVSLSWEDMPDRTYTLWGSTNLLMSFFILEEDIVTPHEIAPVETNASLFMKLEVNKN